MHMLYVNSALCAYVYIPCALRIVSHPPLVRNV